MNKRVRSVCVYCKDEWDDILDIPESHSLGFSFCKKCSIKFKIEELLKSDSSYLLIQQTPDSLIKMAELHCRDREKFRGSPCNWCGEKSVGRIREYKADSDELTIIAACDKHFYRLEQCVRELKGDNNGLS